MSRGKPASRPESVVHSDVRNLLGPPPLIDGEDAAAYEAIYEQILAAIDPKDVFEQFWVRDLADLIWGALRLRRLKTKLFHSAAHENSTRFYNGSMCLPI